MVKHFSDKYDVDSMSAEERNMIYLREIDMTWGCAWSALRKSWKLLKQGLKEGDYHKVDAMKVRICRIRSAMGIDNEELY
jgi:hypothetical protein